MRQCGPKLSHKTVKYRFAVHFRSPRHPQTCLRDPQLSEARSDAELAQAEIAAITAALPRLWGAANGTYTSFVTAAETARLTKGKADKDAIIAKMLAAISPHLDDLLLARAPFERTVAIDSRLVLGERPAGPAPQKPAQAPGGELTPVLSDNRLPAEHRAITGPEPVGAVDQPTARPGHVGGVPFYMRGPAT